MKVGLALCIFAAEDTTSYVLVQDRSIIYINVSDNSSDLLSLVRVATDNLLGTHKWQGDFYFKQVGVDDYKYGDEKNITIIYTLYLPSRTDSYGGSRWVKIDAADLDDYSKKILRYVAIQRY